MNKKVLTAIIIGFLLGVLWLVAIRFITFKSDTIHYHANFALYVNGQKDEFKNFAFYEEVQSCGNDDDTNPKVRVHMHGNVNSVVHVHDGGVTWGQFFANLGYTLGDNVLKTDNGTYLDDTKGRRLTFMLNGETTSNIANRLIESEDKMLISYGNENKEALKKQYDSIPQDADEYNSKQDPGNCSGGRQLTFTERLKHAFGF